MITSCYVLMNELPGANFPGKSALSRRPSNRCLSFWPENFGVGKEGKDLNRLLSRTAHGEITHLFVEKLRLLGEAIGSIYQVIQFDT